MTDKTSFEVHIASARLGVKDSYRVELDQEQMRIGRVTNPNPAVCSWREGSNPSWSTNIPKFAQLGSANPIINELEHEKIYPPSNFVRALEAAWMAWRNGELDNNRVASEIRALFKWLDVVSTKRPKTKFWKGKF